MYHNAKSGYLLSAALLPESHLRGQVASGLDAVARADRIHIAPKERHRVGDSLNFDSATAELLPEFNRWDYLLSIPDASQLIGLEPHAARDSEISVVIAKKQTTAHYLRDHLASGFHIANWYWVCSGPVRFSATDSARKRLDKHGIQFRGKVINSLG